MGCLSALFAAAFPRMALFIIWLLRPTRVDAAFDTWFWPFLGILFLPLTTLLYVVLHTPGLGLGGWEWFWLVVAGTFDLGHLGFTAFQRQSPSAHLPPMPAPPRSSNMA